MRTHLIVRPCSPMSEDVSEMIDALDVYQKGLYPEESNHLDSRQTLSEPNCKFLGAYQDDRLVGIGAVKKFQDYGELKRFYIPEPLRGNGIAELLIATLEYWLIKNRIYQSRLETGIHQHAALKFYERLGYTRTSPFGTYRLDPLSVFMSKDLSSATITATANESSFFVVAFASQLKRATSRYNTVANDMVQLVSKQDGFLGVNSSRNSEGQGFTASYWRD